MERAPSPLPSLKVVIVEDDSTVRLFLRETLERDLGHQVNPKRVRRLLRQMGLEAFYPKPRLSLPDPVAGRYPYLLKGLKITRPDQVWCADITYVGLPEGFAYLVAIMDWFSRYVLAWEVSNSLESAFCVSALERALARRRSSSQRRGFRRTVSRCLSRSSSATSGRRSRRAGATPWAPPSRATDRYGSRPTAAGAACSPRAIRRT